MWAALWKECSDYTACISPDDDSRLDPLDADDIYFAAMSFPIETGLGADNLAPRAVERLPRRALQVLADLLNTMEAEGVWAAGLCMVLIALIPKSDGGRRPIGLMCTVVRIWMRARRPVAVKREGENHREGIYGGKSMGSQRAA